MCGLASEVRHLARPHDGVVVALGGGTPQATAQAINLLAGAGVRILVSAGIAGGLDPELAPGALVIAEAVSAPDGTVFSTDPALSRRLAEALPLARLGRIAGEDRPVAGLGEKRVLAARGALAVDMESHRIAASARRRGLAFLAARAIADPAGLALPQAALAGLGPGGRVRPLAVLARLVVAPAELLPLIRTARAARAAHAALPQLGEALAGLAAAP